MRSWVKQAIGFLTAIIAIANLYAVYQFRGWVKGIEYFIPIEMRLDFSSYLAIQAHQFSMLQFYLVIFSIGLAILGIWGYSSIKDSARQSAKKAGSKVAKELVEKFISEARKELQLGKETFPYKKDDIETTVVEENS